MGQRRKKKKKATSSIPEVQYNRPNSLDTIFEPIILARFCISFAGYLDHGLTREQLICLHKECTEIAFYNNDIHLKIQLIKFSFSKNIPFDCRLKEFFVNLSLNGNDSENRILHYNKCIHIAKATRERHAEMMAYFNLGALNEELHQYYDVIVYYKKCLAITREIGDKTVAMKSCLILGRTYREVKLDGEAISYCKSCINIAKEIDRKDIEMTACFIVGKLYFSQSNYKEALLYSETSLKDAKALGDKRYESMVYLLIQDCQYHMNEYKDAVVTGQKTIAAARDIGDVIGETNAYEILAKSYQSLNQSENANDCLTKSMAIAKKSGDLVLEMNSCFSIGKIYHSQEQLDDAVICMKNCLDIAVKIGDRSKELYVYMALGDSYLQLQQHDNARDCLQKCLDIAKKYGNTHAEGDANILLGKTFDSLHQQSDAILHFKKGIELFGAIGITDHEMDGHFLLGKVYRSCKNYNEAIESLKKAIIIAWKIGDKNMQKDVYHEIGNIYEYMNQFDKAIRYGKKYMEVAKEIGNEDDVMEAYLALGVAYLGLDNYEDTLFNLNEGLKIATELKNTSVAETFNTYLNQLHLRVEDLGKATNFAGFISCGRLCVELFKESSDQQVRKCNEFLEQYISHILTEDYEQAIVCLKRQLALFERCVHYHGTDKVYCLLEIADVHNTLGQYEDSLQCYRESLAIASHVDAKHLQAITYSRQGRIYVKLKRMKKAENSFKEAIGMFEAMFDSLGGEDFKISLLDAYVNCYKDLAKVFAHTEQVEQALVVSDRGRARSLNGLLQKYGMKGGINEDDFEYKDIESLLSENKCSAFFYSVIGQMAYVFIIDSERELQFSVKHFGCSCTHKVTFETFVDRALKEIEVLDQVTDNCENRSLDKPSFDAAVSYTEETRNLTEEFQHCHLSAETRSPPADEKPEKCQETDIKESALEWLHEMLISHNAIYSINQDGTPIVTKNVKYFGQEDEILIIPDGPLHKVPFAALRDPETGQYLSETKRIRLVPSLATLKALQRNSEYHDIKKGALVIGDPLVGKVMFEGEETEFDPLIDAVVEARAVANLFHVTPFTGETATKSAIIERLKQGVAVVHIAAHGSVAKGTIALAPSPEIRARKIPDEEDYMLTMAEVQQAQVHAQLVVLSCCHSGRGEIRAEGVVGMCRAFLASGARAVVASLWAIDDEATLEFMIEFYIRLIEGKSASVSLQQAMEEMRNCYSEPKYWAPFFLMGDDVTIKF